MPEVSPKRRRWPWVVLTIVALVIVAAVAWEFRPLNETERRLVGRWSAGHWRSIYEFRPDRRFTWSSEQRGPAIILSTGTWSATESSIRISSIGGQRNRFLDWRWYDEALFVLFHPAVPDDLEFDGPNQISIAGRPWVRVVEDESE